MTRTNFNPLLTKEEAEFLWHAHLLFAYQVHSCGWLGDLAYQTARAAKGMHLSHPFTLSELEETKWNSGIFFRDAAEVEREYV
jgi:hypothetical protein